MKRGNLELVVGVFVLAGLACLAYLAIHLGKMEVWGRGYQVDRQFRQHLRPQGGGRSGSGRGGRGPGGIQSTHPG